MGVKIYVLVTMLVFAGLVPPLAHALLGLGGLLSLLNVTGVVLCSMGNSVNLSTSTVFPNADVQLRCGGNVVGSTTTDNNGEFSIFSGVLTALLSGSLISSCNVAVTTPLAKCNASLPSTGILSAAIIPLNNIVNGITNNFTTGAFSFLP